MDGFIRKPFALSTLLDTIEQLLPEQPKSEDENFEEMTKVILDKGERGRRCDALTSVTPPRQSHLTLVSLYLMS